MRTNITPIVATLLGCAAALSCQTSSKTAAGISAPRWDIEAAEILSWTADDPRFDQVHALEASGLAVSDRFLYTTSEKYWRVLQIDPDALTARVIALDVPRHTELEGVGYADGALYLCDEAHAAVYRADLPDEGSIAAGRVTDRLPVEALELRGPDVPAGKIGVEGVALDLRADRLWLLLERSGNPDVGCVSTIFPLAVKPSALIQDGDPIVVELEDCNWRLTAIELWQGELLALKTQFPGERYELISIEPTTGRWSVVLEMTELLRAVRQDGWNNNVEGLAVTADGALWMVSDNAWTQIIDDATPPVADEGTLLLRIPPTRP